MSIIPLNSTHAAHLLLLYNQLHDCTFGKFSFILLHKLACGTLVRKQKEEFRLPPHYAVIGWLFNRPFECPWEFCESTPLSCPTSDHVPFSCVFFFFSSPAFEQELFGVCVFP